MVNKADYEIVPYTSQHSRELGQVFGSPKERDVYETSGPGFTLLYQGKVIASAGVIRLWSGVGDGWACLGPDARRHLRAIQFYTHRGLTMVCREHKLRRLQALVVKDFEAACRWATSLGFHVESEMPLAGPNGETLIRFVHFPQGEA